MLNLKVKKEITYQIVSETEADLKNKKISVNSPIAKALLAKAVGDVVDVMTPAGAMQFKILEITL
jgi:transcription elongation factor GreA